MAEDTTHDACHARIQALENEVLALKDILERCTRERNAYLDTMWGMVAAANEHAQTLGTWARVCQDEHR